MLAPYPLFPDQRPGLPGEERRGPEGAASSVRTHRCARCGRAYAPRRVNFIERAGSPGLRAFICRRCFRSELGAAAARPDVRVPGPVRPAYDRRRAPRSPGRLVVELRPPRSNEPRFGRLKDLSRTGARFLTAWPARRGEVLGLRLRGARGRALLSIMAQVVRCGPERGLWAVSVRFTAPGEASLASRRAAPRVRVDLAIRLEDELGRERAYRVKDLSESGVRFSCEEGLAEGESYAFELDEVAGVIPGARIAGRLLVLRLKTDAAGGRLAAARFLP
jgi:hypothetical protein